MAVIGMLASLSSCNVYEFTMAANEEVCFQEFFKKGTQPSLNFEAYKLTKEFQREEINDLSKAGVIEKRKGNIKLVLRVESVTGIVYTAVSQSGKLATFKTKEDERVNMCFKNPDKSVAFVIFDLRTGVYSGDMSNIPTGEDTSGIIEKLEGIRVRLDNSLSLYRQMETYEEKHLQGSNAVLSGVLMFSQLTIAAVALVGWGVTMLLGKSLKQRKIA